jgi:hypothetical protein
MSNYSPLRLEQIEEAFDDLNAVFADPYCFHSEGTWDDRPVQDYALSLSSEFIGQYHDAEIVSRLAKLIEAEDAGRPKDGFRHLEVVRQKVQTRLRRWWSQIDTNSQVVERHPSQRAVRSSDLADTTRTRTEPLLQEAS